MSFLNPSFRADVFVFDQDVSVHLHVYDWEGFSHTGWCGVVYPNGRSKFLHIIVYDPRPFVLDIDKLLLHEGTELSITGGHRLVILATSGCLRSLNIDGAYYPLQGVLAASNTHFYEGILTSMQAK